MTRRAHWRRRWLLAAGASLVVVTAGSSYGVPAQAAPVAYVALGDSYSSGLGTGTYIDDGTSCRRSVEAFPSLIAAARGYALTFRACSGATTADVTSSQLDALGAGTGVVTISVGGNDAGFTSVLTTCALPSWLSDCDGAIDTAQAFINGVLPQRLGKLYRSIHTKAPNATVTVVGYPRLFNGQDCNALTFFSPQEEARLNQTADLLDGVLRRKARAAGFRYADPRVAFTGHAVCDAQEWLNGLSYPVDESYHPNVDGQALGYVPVVSSVTGSAVVVTADVRARAAAAGPRLAVQERRYAAQDARIVPETFRAPDLTPAQAVTSAP